jgi:peptidoglycan/LPS O-acetylase OafA/YrhL
LPALSWTWDRQPGNARHAPFDAFAGGVSGGIEGFRMHIAEGTKFRRGVPAGEPRMRAAAGDRATMSTALPDAVRGKAGDRLVRLECLRGFAALYVFVVHIAQYVVKPEGLLAWPFKFGQEAVMLFFLISGFVIFYSYEAASDKSFGGYLLRRFRRIYPIFLVALGLSALLHSNDGNFDLRTLLGNVFMLQDFSDTKPGVWFNYYGGNTPLWSLSYEWWFYMLFFPIRTRLPEAVQKYVVFGLGVAAIAVYQVWPNQISLFLGYFMIWWTGAELARAYCRRRTVGFAPVLLLGLTVFAFFLPVWQMLLRGAPAGTILHVMLEHRYASFYPALEFRHISFAFAAVVVGLVWQRLGWRGFNAVFSIFAKVAPISYGIYVLHLPIVTSTLLSGVPVPVEVAGYVATVFILAALAEGPFQRWVNRLLSPSSARRRGRQESSPRLAVGGPLQNAVEP